MISRSDFLAYCRALRSIEDNAERAVRDTFWGWYNSHPDATVEEMREFAIGLVGDVAGTYSDAGASLAAEWYDVEAMAEHVKLDTALLSTSVSDGNVERVVHYQAGNLVNDDVGRFVTNLGDYTRDCIRRSANDTIMLNCKRDRRKGVKFARVPSGAETCTWCMMLSGRGFDYSTAESAGEQRHFHRGCDCKIVPGFNDDNPIEGYDPDECKRLASEFKEIDDRDDLTSAEKRMLKLATIDAESSFDFEHSRQLAHSFGECMESRKAAFLEDLTQENYDRTIGAMLRDIGDRYGMELSGEFAFGPGLYSAVPDGYELWATTRMRGQFRDARFLSTDRMRQRGNPDLFAGGKYIEIKTPSFSWNTSDKLHDGYIQCNNRGHSGGTVILSPLRLEEGLDKYVGYAERTVIRHRNQGKQMSVFVIRPDSSIELK